jgi:ribonuclease J
VALVLGSKGEMEAEPEIDLVGLPTADAAGRAFAETVLNAIHDTWESLPRPRRRDPEVVREAVRRAVRAAVADGWGKKPVCTVLIAVV